MQRRLGGGDIEGNCPAEVGGPGGKRREHAQGQHRPGRSRREPGNWRGGAAYEEVTYEGYGPAGVAVIVEVMTDNKNRTVAEIRHIFSKHGGNLGENGCVAWMFDKKGSIVIDKKTVERG